MDMSKLGRRQILGASKEQAIRGLKRIGLGVGNLLNALSVLFLVLLPLRVTRRLMARIFERPRTRGGRL
ncbi:MAG: hypothetical protein Q8P22_10775 [Chloroflexota bacterium]|nr:hypothetical protein [Chloroflexota bacterium]